MLSRFNGGAYVIGVYTTSELAIADAAAFVLHWKDGAGRPLIDPQWITSQHPRRWVCGATGDVLEIVEHDLKAGPAITVSRSHGALSG